MIAYQTDATGRYVAVVECDESPLEPGVFLVPRGAVTVPPPEFLEGEFALWDGQQWTVRVEPVEPEPEPEPEITPEIEREIIEAERRRAYQMYSDPMFFDWQRGVATESDWHEAVAKVRSEHPYPEEL